MPKRKKAKNLQKEQPTRTPHPHNEKAPRSFHEYTPKFRKYHDCTLQVSHVHRCQVSARSNLHPEVSQCAKIRGFGLSKTTLQVSQCLPSPQTDTLQFLNLQNHLLRSLKVTKRHPEVLYAHEVREFRTIQRPNAPQPNTHTTPPKSFVVSDSLQNPLPFKGKFHTLGARPIHRPRHRQRAPHSSDIISFCASRSTM